MIPTLVAVASVVDVDVVVLVVVELVVVLLITVRRHVTYIMVTNVTEKKKKKFYEQFSNLNIVFMLVFGSGSKILTPEELGHAVQSSGPLAQVNK